MCLNHLCPSGVACLLWASGLLMLVSEVRKRLARCCYRPASSYYRAVFLCILHCPPAPRNPWVSTDQGPTQEMESCEEAS